MTQPRILKSSQNLHLGYESPYRIHTAKAYPLISANGSQIILYGHENGVSIVWRGGRPFKRTSALSAVPQKTNGATDAVISLDSDDEGEPSKTFEDKAEFEDDEEELNPSRPYPSILQTLNLSFGTGALHLALLPSSLLKADGSSYRSLEPLKQNLMFIVGCADSTVRLVTLPLTPPSPASKTRADFRSDFTLANAGHEKWGESVVILSGHQKPPTGISVTVDITSPAEPHIIVASHSTEVQGLLLLFRISIKSPQQHVEPFQSIYLSSPAKSISFNPGLSKEHASQLLVADNTGVCRIYDYKLLIRTTEEPTETPVAEKGTWLLSLYAGFHSVKSEPLPQNLGTHAGFGRKTIIDAQWVSGGRAIIILMNDGEWAIWDIEGVGPDAPKGLLGCQGIKGGSKSEYSLSGYLDGAAKSKSSGPPQIAASKFAPMTPGTRRSTEPFSAKGSSGSVRGQISVIEIPSPLATAPVLESVLLWFGETYSVIPDLAKYWTAHSRKTGGSGNLFNGSSTGRMIRFENVDLQGEHCSGVEQLSSAVSSTTPSDILVLGEHRYVIIATSKQSRDPPFERSTSRIALTEKSVNGGELDVVGIDQALARMENGFGSKRKIFQS